MSESDYFEFGVAHDRRYTLEHLWLQLIDEKEGTVKVGMSEFIRADFGDVVRVILPHPEDTSDFALDDEGAPKVVDDRNRDSDADNHEIGISELLVTIRTVDDRILINSPFPCQVLELNGEVEDNADLANDEAYADGWFLIVKPHEYDEDQFLNATEYIEYLNELE